METGKMRFIYLIVGYMCHLHDRFLVWRERNDLSKESIDDYFDRQY